MNFKPYKQETIEGCLPVCLLLLTKGEATQDEELELTIDGIQNKTSYALQILNTFSRKYGKDFEVCVDNRYFLKDLQNGFENKSIKLIHQTITPELMGSISTPCILYIDAHEQYYPHAPHFIIVEQINKNGSYNIFDPWTGESRMVEKDALQKSVELLRSHLLFCPLLITIK